LAPARPNEIWRMVSRHVASTRAGREFPSFLVGGTGVGCD
jgi:hypothetical protein